MFVVFGSFLGLQLHYSWHYSCITVCNITVRGFSKPAAFIGRQSPRLFFRHVSRNKTIMAVVRARNRNATVTVDTAVNRLNLAATDSERTCDAQVYAHLRLDIADDHNCVDHRSTIVGNRRKIGQAVAGSYFRSTCCGATTTPIGWTEEGWTSGCDECGLWQYLGDDLRQSAARVSG
jgi:hypothetical protein